MTPTEKAKELIEKLRLKIGDSYQTLRDDHAKQCALITLDEIIKEYDKPMTSYPILERLKYWQQVKEETEKL